MPMETQAKVPLKIIETRNIGLPEMACFTPLTIHSPVVCAR
ncbi:hypothetical protein VIBNISFn118_1160016 [Vibrio nigripulchritudo SFn118]|nr:hypothetical protein VIBNISFn118_1160016 [Vibrio nigripulchritudo SFn118]